MDFFRSAGPGDLQLFSSPTGWFITLMTLDIIFEEVATSAYVIERMICFTRSRILAGQFRLPCQSHCIFLTHNFAGPALDADDVATDGSLYLAPKHPTVRIYSCLNRYLGLTYYFFTFRGFFMGHPSSARVGSGTVSIA